MPVRIVCPNPACGTGYQVAQENLGGRAKCKNCGTTFTLQISSGETIAARLAGSKPPRARNGPAGDGPAGEGPQ